VTLARPLRDAIEPFHRLCYFAPEVRRPYIEDLGLHPWTAYFGQRAAPMGKVDAPVVTATFYGFSPRLVGRSIPAVWEVISPTEATRLRLSTTAEALRRVLGDLEPPVVAEANHLAQTAVEGCEFAGRPLAAGHHAIPADDDPLAELWRRITVLREYRGDGHVTALVHIGLGPVESLLTSRGFADLDPHSYRTSRGWSDDEWGAAFERCRDAGWLDREGHLTDAGTAVRWEIESETDRLFEGPLEALGPTATERLTELVGGMSAAVLASGEVG
jgi:hypothetical protein